MTDSSLWPEPVTTGAKTVFDSAQLRTQPHTPSTTQQTAWDEYLAAGVVAFRAAYPAPDFEQLAFGQQVTLLQATGADGVQMQLVHGRLRRTDEGVLVLVPRGSRTRMLPVDLAQTLMIRSSWLDDFHLRHLWFTTLEAVTTPVPSLEPVVD